MLAIRMLAEQQRVEEWSDPARLASWLDVAGDMWKPGRSIHLPGGQLSAHSMQTLPTDDPVDLTKPWLMSELLSDTLRLIDEVGLGDDDPQRSGNRVYDLLDRLVKAARVAHHFGYGGYQINIPGGAFQFARDALGDHLSKDPLTYLLQGGGNVRRLRETLQGKRSAAETILRGIGIDFYASTGRDAKAILKSKSLELQAEFESEFRKDLRDKYNTVYYNIINDKFGPDTMAKLKMTAQSPFLRAADKVFRVGDPAVRARFREMMENPEANKAFHKHIVDPAMMGGLEKIKTDLQRQQRVMY